MPAKNLTIGDLTFDRADFATATPEDDCRWCTRGLNGSYFDVQGAHVCGVCAVRARQLSPQDTRAAFLRSILFGSLAAAVAGLAFYALFRITEGAWMIFVSMPVGYIIGKAMRKASGGIGGRRYQVMALVLTYIAIIIASSSALLEISHPRFWAYPLFLLTPFLNLLLGHAGLGALQILFVAAGFPTAWLLTAGAPLRITGPHTTPPPEAGESVPRASL